MERCEMPIADGDLSFPHLLLSVNGCMFAINLSFVRKVTPLPQIIPLPRTAPYILGAAWIFDTVYTVIDLRIWLRQKPDTLSTPGMAILLSRETSNICIVTDRVFPPINICLESLDFQSDGWITGIAQVDDMYINVLSMADLFHGELS